MIFEEYVEVVCVVFDDGYDVIKVDLFEIDCNGDDCVF